MGDSGERDGVRHGGREGAGRDDDTSDVVEYTEAHIEARISEAVAELGIRATVRPPHVFLRGEVPSEQRRAKVAEAVHRLVPDLRIHNEIAVTGAAEPDGTEDLR